MIVSGLVESASRATAMGMAQGKQYKAQSHHISIEWMPSLLGRKIGNPLKQG